MTAADLGPLDWRIAIVDKSGRPTPEFQRRWATQRSNNEQIGSRLTLGHGAPAGTPNDGDEYIDTAANPYIWYIGKGGTWHPAGGIGQLTGDISAGPGVGSQVATLPLTGVTAGNYTLASITVDAKGRVTAATGSPPVSASLVTSSAVSVGFVNVWNDGGNFHIQQADELSLIPAHGFVTSAYASGVTATVYFVGAATGFSGLTPGDAYLGDAGLAGSHPGLYLNQRVGVAVSPTTIMFMPGIATISPLVPLGIITEDGRNIMTEDGRTLTTE